MEATATHIEPPALTRQPGQSPFSGSLRRIHRTRTLLLVLPWLGLAAQGVLAQTSEDWQSAFLAAIGSFLIFFDCFRPERIYRYPMSTLVALGFGVTLGLGPLLFTALEGNSITYNLNVPIDTFGHALLASLIVILAHKIYRNLALLRYFRKFVNRLLDKAGVFATINLTDVLVMGLLGLLALAISSWFSFLAESDSILVKTINGFQFFSIVPVAYYLQELGRNPDGSSRNSSRRALMLLLVFILLILFVSFGRNSRSIFAVPIATLGIGIAFKWTYYLIKIRLRSILVIFIVVLFVLPLLSDLATAMVMVRVYRGDVSAIDLASLTLDQLKDRDSIKRFKIASEELDTSREWSEAYVSNVFLARFSNAKFPDSSLQNAKALSQQDKEEVAEFQWLRLMVFLPQPLLSLFGVNKTVKQEVQSYGYGDLLYYLATKANNSLGGFRVGHFFGTGVAGFDYFYTLILAISLLLIFPLVDSHVEEFPNGSILAAPLLSVIAVTQFYSWFTMSNSPSVIVLLGFPLREFTAPVLLYSSLKWMLDRLH